MKKIDSLAKSEVEGSVEAHTFATLRKTGTDISLRSAAAVRAKFDAYLQVYASFESYIIKQAKDLNQKRSELTAFQKLSLARLVWDWIVKTEEFLTENESVLTGVSEKVRERYTEESFNSFSPQIKEVLIRKFNDLRNEMLTKFSEVLVDAVRQEEALKNGSKSS